MYKTHNARQNKNNNLMLLLPIDIIKIIIKYSNLIPKWIQNHTFNITQTPYMSKLILNPTSATTSTNCTIYSQDILLTKLFSQIKLRIKTAQTNNFIFGIVHSNTHFKYLYTIQQHKGYFIDSWDLFTTISPIQVIKRHSQVGTFKTNDTIKIKLHYNKFKQTILNIKINHQMVVQNYPMQNKQNKHWMFMIYTIKPLILLCK